MVCKECETNGRLSFQTEVIAGYGFSRDGEGIVHFTQLVKLYEREDSEIGRLHKLVKAHFIPPLHTGNGRR